MSFVVTKVSRGDIHLNDGRRSVRVLGEGLLVSKPGDPAFVVYLNSIGSMEFEGRIEAMGDDVRREVVGAIKEYFFERGMVVDFE